MSTEFRTGTKGRRKGKVFPLMTGGRQIPEYIRKLVEFER